MRDLVLELYAHTIIPLSLPLSLMLHLECAYTQARACAEFACAQVTPSIWHDFRKLDMLNPSEIHYRIILLYLGERITSSINTI